MVILVTMLRFSSRLLALTLLVSAAAVAGCGSSDSEETQPDFRYGVEDMKALVVGKWTGTLTPTGKPASSATLELSYAPPGTKPACGDRTLCIDASHMTVKGTLTTSDGTYQGGLVTGTLDVFGTEISSGSLSLTFPDGAVVTFPIQNKTVSAEGDVFLGGNAVAKISLSRS